MLDLAAAEIESALKSAEEPVAKLGTVMGSVATQMPQLDLVDHHITQEVQQAIVALQFHDALVQRLTHVRDALLLLGRELGSDSRQGWDQLRDVIRTKYSLEDERRLYDLVIADAPPEAIRAAFAAQIPAGDAGRIDLF